MEKMQREHIGWVDWLRIIACFLVLVSHSCDPFVAQFDANRFEFLSGAFWGSLVRPCVPLFVMISGVLLLPLRIEMGAFYSRRLKRVVIPLVIWSIVTPLLYYLYFSVMSTINPNIAMENYTWQVTLKKMYLFVFNFSYDTTPLWYLYMLVGIYLIIPIIAPWLAQASKRDIRRFLYIWGVTLVLPYVQLLAPALGYTGNYGNMGLLGVCEWNPYGMFYYFSGFLGYIVLAHYLVRFPLEWSWNRTLTIAITSFLVGYVITALGFIAIQKYYPADYAYLEILWYFSGVNVFMMTFPIFIVVQKLNANASTLVNRIAALTFGVYLCHFLVVQFGYDVIHTYIPLPPYLQIPLIALLSFALTLGVVWLLGTNKLTKKAVM